MTWSGFLKFAATLSFVTVAGFHLLESFTFFRVVALLLNIGGSFVLTLAFVATFDGCAWLSPRPKRPLAEG